MTPGDLLLRADASDEIGAGHWMRCLALAQEWRRLGGTAALVSSRSLPILESRFRANGCEVLSVAAEPGSAADVEQTLALAERRGSRWIAADGYAFGTKYQKSLSGGSVRLLVIDDFGHAGRYEADAILNPNTSASPALYVGRGRNTRLLLGPRYALLRSEFRLARQAHRQIARSVRRILVTLGGSDCHNATASVLANLSPSIHAGCDVTVVAGGGNSHVRDLQALVARDSPRCRLVQNVENMAELMGWADLAFASASTTCWELAALGTPTLALVLARNQETVASTLQELGAVRNLGWFERLEPVGISSAVADLDADQRSRATLSATGQVLVDGGGAERVCRVLMSFPAQGSGAEAMRPATLADVVELFALANDPEIRARSFGRDPIPWTAHAAWFRERLASRTCAIWVAEKNGILVGQVRYELSERAEPHAAEVSVAVASEARKMGIGTQLLSGSWREACKKLGVERARGVVRDDNQASAATFAKAGFRLVKRAHFHQIPCLVFERGISEEV